VTVDTDKSIETTVTINSSATAATTVTLTNPGNTIPPNTDPETVNGYYQFKITVDDGVNPPVADTVIVGVYPTCGAAAAGDPDDLWDATGDLDSSCKVDLADFALFAANWLSQSDKY
jgi:hypothetical protein